MDELKMRVSKEFADTFLEISRIYNSLGKFELASCAQKFATVHLKRYAKYTQQFRAEQATKLNIELGM